MFEYAIRRLEEAEREIKQGLSSRLVEIWSKTALSEWESRYKELSAAIKILEKEGEK